MHLRIAQSATWSCRSIPKAWLDPDPDLLPEQQLNELAAILSIGVLRWVRQHGQSYPSFAHFTVILFPRPRR